MEQIIIGNEAVEVPADVVSAGRDAVQAWHRDQLTVKGIAFTVAENGDPVFPKPAPAADADVAAADDIPSEA